MDNYNNQQGNPYQQQGNPYQQQGNPYQQQGNPYQQQGNPYQQGPVFQQVTPYKSGGYYNSNNSEQQKAPNIFKQFVYAFVPTKYDRLTKVTTGSMIGFVTLLVLIATLLSFATVIPSLASLDMEELTEALPDFMITNGHLHIDEEFMYDEGTTFVYMTEDIDEFDYEDAADVAAEGYRNVILVGRDKISAMQNWQYSELDLSEMDGVFDISREWIVSTIIPIVWIALVFGFIFFFIGRGLAYFLFASVYLLFAMMIAAIMHKNLETGELFRTAVYAKVLMFVVSTIISLLPFGSFSVPFLLTLILKAGITIGFMALAIAKLPDNRPAPMPMGPGMGQGWQ